MNLKQENDEIKESIRMKGKQIRAAKETAPTSSKPKRKKKGKFINEFWTWTE